MFGFFIYPNFFKYTYNQSDAFGAKENSCLNLEFEVFKDGGLKRSFQIVKKYSHELKNVVIRVLNKELRVIEEQKCTKIKESWQ